MKKNIAVLFGGCSTEYSVSLQSAYAVLTHIDREKYEVIAIGITESGNWYEYTGPYEDIREDIWLTRRSCLNQVAVSQNRSDKGLYIFKKETGPINMVQLDAVFPMLHGKNGEDGTVQGMFELAGIPIVGCDTLSSALCMDKTRAHDLVSLIDGIEIPKSVTLSARKVTKENIDKINDQLKYPLFVKPVRAGSSYGISKVEKEENLKKAINNAFIYDSEVVIEEMIEGFEVGCAIIDKNGNYTVGRIDEIEVPGGFFDFKEKYGLVNSKIHMPARIDQETEKRLQDAAVKIFEKLGCSGYARVDMFLTPDKKIVFNEVNTIPGFTSHSRFPNMLKGIGMSFSDVVNTLIEITVK